MLSNHVINENEHRAWFERISVDPHARWYMHENTAGIADGVVYFTKYYPEKGQAFWGFYRDPDAVPGSGFKLGIDGLDQAFGCLRLRKLNAEVLVNNERSLRFHERLGFQREGLVRMDGLTATTPIDVVCFGISKKEWAIRRRALFEGDFFGLSKAF